MLITVHESTEIEFTLTSVLLDLLTYLDTMLIPLTPTALTILALVQTSSSANSRGVCDGFIRTSNTSILSGTDETKKTKSEGIDCEIANLPTVRYFKDKYYK